MTSIRGNSRQLIIEVAGSQIYFRSQKTDRDGYHLPIAMGNTTDSTTFITTSGFKLFLQIEPEEDYSTIEMTHTDTMPIARLALPREVALWLKANLANILRTPKEEMVGKTF